MERIQGPIFDLIALMTGKGDVITTVISFFSVAVIIFIVFPIHECAHGFMAKLLGDDTAEREGRLTLNPFAHIDPMGALCMCLCCIGWAKPTPVNISRCRKVKARTALALTSLAGPLANILLSLVFIIVEKILLGNAINLSATVIYIAVALDYAIYLNIYLAVFNLLPIPPFDGSKILYSFLPAKGIAFMERNGQYIHWGFLILLLIGVLDIPLGFISNIIYWLLDKATFFL